jgi:predicted dehydrogenase
MPLFVAYYRRRLPGFLKVKELLAAKAIGDVRLVNIRFYRPFNKDEYSNGLPWRVIPEKAGGGLFFDLAAHQLDILDEMVGNFYSGK